MKRFILTGTPGAGKTAVVRQLELDGFSVVEEAATDILLWSKRGSSLNRGNIPHSSIRLSNYKDGGRCEHRTSRTRFSFTAFRAGSRGNLQHLGFEFVPIAAARALDQAAAIKRCVFPF